MSDQNSDTPSTGDDEAEELPIGRWLAANTVILFTLITSLLMACPWPVVQPRIQPLLSPALPLLDGLGLSHRLRLFAPSPPQWTGSVVFRVTRKDATVHDWVYPRSVLAPGDPAGTFNRYLFLYLVWNSEEKLRSVIPAFARYVAKQNASSDNPPVAVDIVQRLGRIPPPEQGIGATSPQPSMEVPILHYDAVNDESTVTGQPFVW